MQSEEKARVFLGWQLAEEPQEWVSSFDAASPNLGTLCSHALEKHDLGDYRERRFQGSISHVDLGFCRAGSFATMLHLCVLKPERRAELSLLFASSLPPHLAVWVGCGCVFFL